MQRSPATCLNISRHRVRTPFAFAWLLSVLMGLSMTAVAQSSDWYLLEFAESPPPCADAPEDVRCLGTSPRVARFEMRDGERLEMLTGADTPPVWTAFEGLWVYATRAVSSYEGTAIELTATPMGARLMISDRGHHYLQSVPLNRWVALEDRGLNPALWVRITPH